MIVGCYVLDLYCEARGCTIYGLGVKGPATTAQFTGRTRAGATRSARNAGWALTHPCVRYPEGRVRCPACKKAKR